MQNNFTKKEAESIIHWYDKNKRSLPWRDTNNPYDVWLSEIMLQQTRIEAVKDKFIQFKEALPTIQDLADCEEDTLFRLWEGLGYYNRARNLKKCATIIHQELNDIFPTHYEELIQLPGIGDYTASAIASICANEAVMAIDGNVLRILARYIEEKRDIRDKNTIQELRNILSPIYQYSLSFSSLNQGLMELGETICIPKGKPLCSICPLSKKCLTHTHSTYAEIPYRSPLKKRRIEKRTVLIVRDYHNFLVHKRPAHGLLANLYEFINVEGHLSKKESLHIIQKLGYAPTHIHSLPQAKHLFKCLN